MSDGSLSTQLGAKGAIRVLCGSGNPHPTKAFRCTNESSTTGLSAPRFVADVTLNDRDTGIAEYWIVSPDDHQITQLILQDDRYTESIETTSITMKVAPQATVNLTRVW